MAKYYSNYINHIIALFAMSLGWFKFSVVPARLLGHSVLRCAWAVALGLAPAHATSLENWVATAVRFTDWPAQRSATQWTVCQPAGERVLLMEGIRVRKQGFQIVSVASPKETGPCDLFVTAVIKGESLAPWLLSLHSRPVLTLGLGHDFCTSGGGLCVAQNRAGRNAFVVNRNVLSAAGLRATGHLPVHPNTSAVTNVARAQ
jgi:YfiR/HmsC-like